MVEAQFFPEAISVQNTGVAPGSNSLAR